MRGGGRWNSSAGEGVARPGQQASVRASGRSRARARSVPWLGEQAEGGARQWAFNGAWRSTARCPAATRATGELRPLNRSSCLGVTASARRPQESRHRRWGRRRRARAEPGYDVNAVGWAAQVGFAWPVSVRRVGCERWWEALGPAVAAVLRRSCSVNQWRGLAWPHARRRAWARTRGARIS
jgi:hypothetical protein